jgi:hypothetical protein
MPTHEQAEPGDTEPVTLPICGDPPVWKAEVLPDGATFTGEPRTMYATMILAGALSGTGLSGLACNCRPKAGGETTAVVREAVRAAFAVADEVLRQAWDGPPAATGVAS